MVRNIADETRLRIVSVAAQMLVSKGYDSLRVNDVMKNAGLTHGGFYAHFRSKAALLEAVVQQSTRDGYARLASIVVDSPEPLEDLLGALTSGGSATYPLRLLDPGATADLPDVRSLVTTEVKRLAGLISKIAKKPDHTSEPSGGLGVLACVLGVQLILSISTDENLSQAARDVAKALARRSGEI